MTNDLAYQLSNISFEYDGNEVLDISELAIRKNQITSLIGSNGSGKTTLLNLLAFLEKPVAGELSFFGNDVTNISQLVLRRRVAMVSQTPYLLRGTVFDNIVKGLKFHGLSKHDQEQQAEQAMHTVGITEIKDRNVKKLSGGEAQKVTLARALALQPEVLLMDEPFSHLDRKSTDQLEVLLRQLVEEKHTTVVLSTHDHLQGMILADQGISLVEGRPVNAPLLNLFQGRVIDHYFDTGKIQIFLPEDIQAGKHLVVDPAEIVLSMDSLTSSMRNSFKGRVITISEDKGRVWLAIDTDGEKFHVQITRESLQDLLLNLGSEVWINFKSTSVKVF